MKMMGGVRILHMKVSILSHLPVLSAFFVTLQIQKVHSARNSGRFRE